MLENFVAAASADAVLLTFAPALPDAVPDDPFAAVPRVVMMLLKLELDWALTAAALPMPLTVTWLLADSVDGFEVFALLLETKDPEITPLAASDAAELLVYSDLADDEAEL